MASKSKPKKKKKEASISKPRDESEYPTDVKIEDATSTPIQVAPLASGRPILSWSYTTNPERWHDIRYQCIENVYTWQDMFNLPLHDLFDMRRHFESLSDLDHLMKKGMIIILMRTIDI